MLITSDTIGQQCAPEHRDTRSHWTAMHFLACKGKTVLSRLALDSCNPVSSSPRGRLLTPWPSLGAPAQSYRSPGHLRKATEVMRGEPQRTQSLLKCGAGTPRIAESARGPASALKRLSKESARDNGLTPTESARVPQDMEKRLLNAKDVDGRLPCMVAKEYGHEELASYLFLRAELVSLRDSFSVQVQRARKGG